MQELREILSKKLDSSDSESGNKEENEEEKQTNQEIEEKKEDTNKKWNSRFEKLAYFIEHDELEKVNTNFEGMNSFIETKEFAEAINELDKSIFVLEHIHHKYAFSLENIF